MVNGPEQTYVERKGKLELAQIQFRDEEHLFQIAQRICNSVGRRVDQTTPLADARLKDGSRVNVIVPPLCLRGTAISIRKFSAKPITLDMMAGFGSMSPKMATALKIAGASRFNIVISGGTGSGKTTMLNALSKMIDPGERVLTIEDAAELRLQQPHWLPLETRPANLEGQGEITIRDLVKNALRMRPDRIILGEIRGSECFDMLAAMNTGHDGSMCTLHANSPREALARMENMVMMSDIKVPKEAISRQIADSVELIIQVKRLRDGSRRVTNVTEVIGMEGPVIVTQELFKFEYLDESADGKIIGEYRSMGLRPYTLDKAKQYRLRPGVSGSLSVIVASVTATVPTTPNSDILMPMIGIARRALTPALLIILPLAFFLAFFHPEILNIGNVGWLLDGTDNGENALGAHAYWHDAGAGASLKTMLLNAPDGVPILYTDSNPLLTLIAKPLSALMPTDAQLVGPFILFNLILQAVFAWLLLRHRAPGTLALWAGVVFLAFPPTLAHRYHPRQSDGALDDPGGVVAVP